jgi:hypothetical protein
MMPLRSLIAMVVDMLAMMWVVLFCTFEIMRLWSESYAGNGLATLIDRTSRGLD